MDGTGEQLAALAAGRRALFEGGQHAVTGSGGRVHDVVLVELLGQQWPSPACSTPTLGGEMVRLEPTAEAVTCRRCLRLAGVEPDAAFDHPTLF